MALPMPAPGDIAARGAAVFEQALPGIDARTPNTVATTYTRVNEMTIFDLYLYLAYIQRELFVTTAQDYLPDHAAVWQVPRNQPTGAAGNVTVWGNVGAPFPAGAIFSVRGSNITYIATAAVNIGADGTALVPVQAQVTGAAGNLAAGTVLTLASPIEYIYPQSGTVDANGLTGGADLEDIEDWRARILAVIRQRPMGGAQNDYVDWAEAALTGVQYVNPVGSMFGLGTVGVVILMAGPAVPTPTEIATVQAYIADPSRKPLTADVTVVAGTLNPVPVTLHLNPDTTLTRAAATTALQYFFMQSAAIGGTIYFSRLDAAIANGDGEYSHEMIAPTADVPAPSNTAMNTLGLVTFQ